MSNTPGPWEVQTREQIANLERIVAETDADMAESLLSDVAKQLITAGWRRRLAEVRAQLPIAIAMDQREAPHV